MTNVIVVDDQTLIREAVCSIISTHPDINVVGQAIDGETGIELARKTHPDVVLMDIRMPGIDGIKATEVICSDPVLSDTHVLILTTFEEDEYVLAALRAGASGFIGKGAEPDEIVRAIIAVHEGDRLLSPKATHALINRYLQSDTSSSFMSPTNSARLSSADAHEGRLSRLRAQESLKYLTDREREVLLLVARGLSNADIAEDLYISPHTAKTHINRIMTKTHSHDRAQLVILAYESGMLQPSQTFDG